MPDCQSALPLQPAIVDVSVVERTSEPSIVAAVRQRLGETGRPTTAAVAAVTIDRSRSLYCLLVDCDWLGLAERTRAVRPELVSDLGIPPAAILAILDGPWSHWRNDPAEAVSWSVRGDGVIVASMPSRQPDCQGHRRATSSSDDT